MELGDAEIRDRAIERGRGYEAPDAKTKVYGKELLVSIAETLKAGPDAKVDLQRWDDQLKREESVGRSNLPYFMGRFLELRGRKEEAKNYYQKSADTEILQSRRLPVVLAADALRRLSK